LHSQTSGATPKVVCEDGAKVGKISESRVGTEPGTTSLRHIAGLDLVRFFAAFSVMAFHYFAWTPLSPLSTGAHILGHVKASRALADFTWFGWVGVEIFFVISGFVIAFSAENAGAWAFARARVLRLAPGAWICASLTLALSLAFGQPLLTTIDGYVHAVLFLPFGPYIDGVYWTLAIEIAFYLLVFLLLLNGRARQLELLGMLIGVGSALFLFLTILKPGLLYRWDPRWFEVLLLRHGVFFAIGVSLWACWRRGVSLARIAFISVMLIAALREIALASKDFAAGMEIERSPLAPSALFLVILALMVAALASNAVFATRPKLVETLRVLGLATYPLYLVHQVLGAFALKFLIAAGAPPIAAAFLAGVFFVGLAIVIARYAEPPLRGVLRDAMRGNAGRLAPAATP
jgi:peptidoglycan/LPS O-acetylase OafA/YrhL